MDRDRRPPRAPRRPLSDRDDAATRSSTPRGDDGSSTGGRDEDFDLRGGRPARRTTSQPEGRLRRAAPSEPRGQNAADDAETRPLARRTRDLDARRAVGEPAPSRPGRSSQERLAQESAGQERARQDRAPSERTSPERTSSERTAPQRSERARQQQEDRLRDARRRVPVPPPAAPVEPSDRPVAEPTAPRAKTAEGRNQSLVVSSIAKSYKKRPVVRDVSLELRRGEIVGLLGPNGAGKTTCFYMIIGLIPVDRGRIGVMGEDVTALPMYRRARLGLGYLPQESSIFRGLTVEQNIRAALELTDLPREKRERRLDQLLGEFSIARLRKSPAVALSGGERRRVEIARALASGPSFILLDEPFAGVDPIAVGDIRSLVWQLKDRGIGVLITDHNVRETLGIIDRAYILHDGKVLMEGEPEAVVNDENVRRVYLGEGFKI